MPNKIFHIILNIALMLFMIVALFGWVFVARDVWQAVNGVSCFCAITAIVMQFLACFKMMIERFVDILELLSEDDATTF